MIKKHLKTTWSNHGTIIRTGITCNRYLLNSAYLSSRAQLAINKKQNYFSLPDHQLAENVILVFGFYKEAKKR